MCQIKISSPRCIIDINEYADPDVVIHNTCTGYTSAQRQVKDFKTEFIFEYVKEIQGRARTQVQEIVNLRAEFIGLLKAIVREIIPIIIFQNIFPSSLEP